MLSSINGTDLITLTEHNCVNKCVVSENGAEEAFIAGYIYALTEGKLIDEALEYAAFTMITALKVEGTVN